MRPSDPGRSVGLLGKATACLTAASYRRQRAPTDSPLTLKFMRYTILAITAATALSVAACGSSSSPGPAASKSSITSPTSSSSTATPTPQAADDKDRVSGLIASVSGNTIQVNQKNGSATVDINPSTQLAEITPAQLTDVTPGSCLTARLPHDSAQGAPARNVMIAPATNGGCNSPQNARASLVRGTVTSVNGNTVVVNVNQNGSTSQATVTVDNNTTYAKRASATSASITQGKCLAARGTDDTSGALQATSVTVAPAQNGWCRGARR
jgi:hypothetical protein